ncbi:hypothetical protein VSR01_10410 [Actinacidiphila sp. DG2A-62]|uniref:hypothetical protein n=1 Tax=Actinacidiphila sp. DG2A-62 TaxID=3108821 RepID=UPI002DBCE004|nr:hypothetical protein [Actinacidiphila sp. DG2A-62]MEC3993931.1 hypothetical protein [Actinacidiphila sp. DG2A-62]
MRHPDANGARDARDGDRLLVAVAGERGGGLAVLGVLALGGVGLALAVPFVLGHTLDAVLRGRPAGGWIALCTAAVAGQTLIAAASDVLAATTTADLTAGLRRRAVRHVLDVGPPVLARGAEGPATWSPGWSATPPTRPPPPPPRSRCPRPSRARSAGSSRSG